MADCTCSICSSLSRVSALQKWGDKIHTDKQEYKTQGGMLTEAGILKAAQEMQDYRNKTGWKPIPEGLLEAYIYNSREYLACRENNWGRNGPPTMNVWNIIHQFLDMQGWGVPGFNNHPPSNVTGRSLEEFNKNLLASLKVYRRWIINRSNMVRLEDAYGNLLSLGLEWVNKEGKYPKRLQKLFYDKKIKLETSQFETVCNLLSESLSKPGTYTVSFDREFLRSTKPSAYCHGGSCWWTNATGSRTALYNYGGFGLRLWEGSNPVSRVWVAPVGDNLVLFNAYGTFGLGGWANLLCEKWGTSQAKIELYNQDRGDPYINSSQGVLLIPQGSTEKAPKRINLNWSNFDTPEDTSGNLPVIANLCAFCGEESSSSICPLCSEVGVVQTTVA